MSSAGKYLPSFLLSLGAHGGFLLVIGLVLSVTGGPRHQSVEMDVVRASQATVPSEPEAAPPPAPDRPLVRARRSPRASRDPAPPTPTPVVDTGPPAPNAADTAMPATAAPPAGGSEDGVLGGSTAPQARSPGEGDARPPPPPPERRVYDMADLDAPPSLVGACTAQVPAFARQTNQSGWVMVQFTLDSEGRVSSPRVRASSPPGVFDESALDAIRRCRYTPPRVGGRAVSVTFRQRLRFEP
ncbi:MAG: energy transducer TonB [Deltaproteobacteria bacterium]|nr:energy transducer TonB [Deltaproteobacteria bacterium]